MADRKPDRYAVFGHPVGHSLSPRIHAMFAEASDQAMTYEAIEAEPGHFGEAVAAFEAGGGIGANVTVPFKLDACELASELTPRARLAGAVNTLQRRGPGEWLGDNTDGAGLVRDLTANLGATLTERRILILGAGGATRGILGALQEQRPALVTVANRTPDKAERLVRDFAAVSCAQGTVAGCGLDALDDGYELVLNATAAGLQGTAPALSAGILAPGAWCYDLAYGDAARPFLAWARGAGAGFVSDGLGMLVEQAAESFGLWRGVRPATAPVIRALRRDA